MNFLTVIVSNFVLTMSFTDEDEIALIDLIHNYPIVYNTDHKNYRNKFLKEKTWQAIADKLGKPKEECKRRWKFVRDGYQRFKKKHPVEAVSPSMAKIRRHNKLMFLDQVFKPRQDRTKVNVEDNEDYADDGEEDPIDISVKEEIVTVPVTFTEENPFYGQEPDDYDEDQTDNFTPDDTINRVHVKKRQSRECTPSASEKKDDVEYFCLHVAEVLRKLPPLEKAKAKKHLNEVLSDYEILAAKIAAETPSTSTHTDT